MNAGQLKVSFGSLEAGAADIQTSAGQIESRLGQLEGDLKPLRSDWTGAASESYQQAQVKWNTAMQDMRNLLTQIGQAVTTSNSDYQSAENQNTGLWG